ncbi:MAG: hypothetical protein WC758_04220 [Candidatus Woesearchaeota archaeon]|jgi:tRNA (guanine37-N1)-methyltransferase
MFGLKVNLIDAEKAKKKIIEEDILDQNYFFEKNEDVMFFPLKRMPNFVGFEIVEKEFIKKEVGTARDLKTLLVGQLSNGEFDLLKTAFDTVGTIAILEIDDDLRKKENIIAEALLKSNPHIKTVLRKDDKHDGEFRTQKMKWLAGENTKETIHKENGVNLLLNVEEVYFSPRLSTERKRISEEIKSGEDVLVMFSGCAPYPCTLAKNTKAKTITGIEINPEGHRYGLKNLELNKIKNVTLINGDVKLVVPKLYSNIIGLKSAIIENELSLRLAENPTLMEFHLFPEDLFSNRSKLEKNIVELKKKGIKIFLHMPFPENKSCWLGSKDTTEVFKVLNSLGSICKQYDIKAIVHVGIALPEISEDELINNIKKLKEYYDYFYFENAILNFSDTYEILRIGKAAQIKNMCIDVSHLYIFYKDNDKLINHIKVMQENFNTYFHLSDSDGQKEGLVIGSGKIDFDKILPLVNLGIIEVINSNESKAEEMINSYRKIISLQKKFDRILMPLPKSAGDFLDSAIIASKKGTIIHFYYFLHVDNFIEAEKLVDEACKRVGKTWKKIALVKCGQHAPRVFRICLDFEILD